MRYAVAIFCAALVQLPIAPPDKPFTNTMFVSGCVVAAFVLLFAHLNEKY